jgi:hypothetical protein
MEGAPAFLSRHGKIAPSNPTPDVRKCSNGRACGNDHHIASNVSSGAINKCEPVHIAAPECHHERGRTKVRLNGPRAGVRQTPGARLAAGGRRTGCRRTIERTRRPLGPPFASTAPNSQLVKLPVSGSANRSGFLKKGRGPPSESNQSDLGLSVVRVCGNWAPTYRSIRPHRLRKSPRPTVRASYLCALLQNGRDGGRSRSGLAIYTSGKCQTSMSVIGGNPDNICSH